MRIEFNGGSWALGALSATVYFGHISPWWFLLTPIFLLTGLLPFTITWART